MHYFFDPALFLVTALSMMINSPKYNDFICASKVETSSHFYDHRACILKVSGLQK